MAESKNTLARLERRYLAPLSRPVSVLFIPVTVLVISLVQLQWLRTFRGLGNLNGDETRYLAYSFDLLRSGSFGLDVDPPWFGPVVPFLSSILMRIAGGNIDVALSIQALLLSFLALATWMVSRTILRPWPTRFAVVGALMLPGVVAATQSYLLVLGAAGFLILSLGILLNSDHGQNAWIWLLGISISLMVLSRGQTLVFVPALVVASLYHCSGRRSTIVRLSVSLVCAGVPTAIYLLTTRVMLGYLTGGFGMPIRSSIGSRITFRLVDLRSGLGHLVSIVAILLLLYCLVSRWSHALTARTGITSLLSRLLNRDARTTLAIATITAQLSMLVSPNQGEYGMFDVPWLIPIFILVLSMIDWLSGWKRALSFSCVAVGLLWTFLNSTYYISSRPLPSSRDTYRVSLMAAANSWDPRMESRDKQQVQEALSEWEDFDIRLDDILATLEAELGRPVDLLFNQTSMNYHVYAGELISAMRDRERRRVLNAPFSGSEPAEMGRIIEERDHSDATVLLVPRIRGDSTSRESRDRVVRARSDENYLAYDRVLALARKSGWTIVARLPMPLGDEMLIMSPPVP